MSPLEAVAVLTNVLGVWLTVQRIRWCWPVGLVAVALYGWIFFEVKLYSDMLLQGVYAVLQAYGWWRWRDADAATARIRVERLARGQLRNGLLAGVAGGLALGALMQTWTDAALPWLDAVLTAFSLVASLWAARKQVASWWLWIVLDTVYAAQYLAKGLALTAALYAAFVVLAAWGLQRWRHCLRGQERAAPAPAPLPPGPLAADG